MAVIVRETPAVGMLPRQRAVRWRMLAILGVGMLTLLAKGPELLLPIGPDQGTYSYLAETILRGGRPYVDAFDNKPPGTYYLHAAALALVPPGVRWEPSCLSPSLLQPCGYVAIQLLDLVWTAATLVALWFLARRLLASTRGAWFATGLAAVFLNVSQVSKEGSTPEKQLLLPMVLAYVAWLTWLDRRQARWLITAGLLSGVAFLFKQTALSIPLALALWWLWTRRPVSAAVRAAGPYLLGFAPPLLVASGYLAAVGALGAFWEASFAYNAAQGGSQLTAVPYAFLRESWHIFQESSALLWLLAAGGVLLSRSDPRGIGCLAICWAVADLLSLFMGGAKFAQVYYVQLVPALAVNGAVALDALWRATRGERRLQAALGLLLAGVFVLSTPLQAQVTLRVLHERLPGRAVPSAEQQVAQVLNTDATFQQSRRLFVWGDASQLYVLTHATSPSRFFHGFPLSQVFVRGPGYQERRAELLRAFSDRPPAAIAIDPATSRNDPDGSQGYNLSSFPELRDLLAAAYAPVPASTLPAGWQLYLRRASS